MYKKVDTLGRIVLPKYLRKKLNIQSEDFVEIVEEDNKIIITNPNNRVMDLEDIRQLYKNVSNFKDQSEYYKGFANALSIVLGEQKDEN